jgi:hypothetical protein
MYILITGFVISNVISPLLFIADVDVPLVGVYMDQPNIDLLFLSLKNFL